MLQGIAIGLAIAVCVVGAIIFAAYKVGALLATEHTSAKENS